MNASSSSCSFGQAMADQGPKYDSKRKKRKKTGWSNPVVSKSSGVIRPDKRFKPHYF